MISELLRHVAILSAAESPVGYLSGLSAIDLQVSATLDAAASAGIAVSAIDGIFVSASGELQPGSMPALELASALGVRPRHVDNVLTGGASPIIQLAHAALAIASGRCTYALIAYASTQASGGGRPKGGWGATVPRMPDRLENATGWRGPVSVHGLIATRHMHDYGTTRHQLAEVAVSDSLWAEMNPAAVRREPLTVDEVLDAPVVSSPLGRLDCCLVTDGGGAVILGPAEHDGPEPRIRISGYGEAHSHRRITQAPSLTESAAIRTGSEAFEMAGMSHDDIDVVMLYDAFTDMPIILLEDLGWCRKGEGGPFVASGVTRPGGALPMNTQGGGLSHCHPGMYGIFLLVEAVSQLRGRCGSRQVEDASVVLCHGVGGGAFGSHATVILEAS